MKFKVGDIVRLKKNGDPETSKLWLTKYGTISSCRTDVSYEINWKGQLSTEIYKGRNGERWSSYWFEELNGLELIKIRHKL